jgi:uncharacterized membrane protein
MNSFPWSVRASAAAVTSVCAVKVARRHGAIFVACVFFALLLFTGSIRGQAQEPVQTLHNHVRPSVANGQAARVGLLSATQRLKLSIVLPLRNQAELTGLLGSLYDPTSSNYHQFLSVEQFTERFGPTEEDYQSVVSFAQASGFTVAGTSPNRLVVPIEGSVTQVNNAFHVSMTVYQHPTEDRTFFSPDREPSLNLSVPVAHIAGLNNFSLPRPLLTKAQAGQAIANVTGSGPEGSYLGSDMRAAYYGASTLTGTGQAVGLLEFGGYSLSDVNLTFSESGQSYGVPINNVLLDGATGVPDGGDPEQVLDIVQAIGMAPGLSQVRVYIGEGLDDANIFNAMATENICKQISVSWGWYPEDAATDDVFFEEFAAQGQSIFIASGDSGAFDAAISPYFYPAEDEYVTTVGGTHLTTTAAGGEWVSETVWNSYGAGSGGGISPDSIAIPSWQAGVATSSNGGSTTLRNEPDVAMEGDFDNFNCDLGECEGGWAGTSFAAPRWAGFMALVNQQAVEAGTAPSGGIGFINPAIYSIGKGSSYDNDFHDITSGNNDTGSQPVWFSATTGYDLTTGWGSANGQNLINALAGPQTPGFWIAASSGNLAIKQGATGTTSVKVTYAGGFKGSVTLAVTSALPNGVTASWGTNPTTGSSTLTFVTSDSAVPGQYKVTITGTSGTIKVTTTLSLNVVIPTFTLSGVGSLNLGQGSSSTSNVYVLSEYGFTGSVQLAVTGLPAGVTASFAPNPTSTGSSVLTLTVSSSATPGQHTLTITGVSGTLKVTTTLALGIFAPTFTISGPGSWNIGQGSTNTSFIDITPEYGFTGSVALSVTGLPTGVTASFSPNPASPGTIQMTVKASSSASPGQYTLTIAGASGSLKATTTVALGVFAPTFALSTAGNWNIGQGASNTSYVYVVPEYGFTGSVNLAVAGLPGGVTASWNPNPTNGTSLLTLTASSSAALGQYKLTITGTSGSLKVSTTVAMGVFMPTFTVSSSGSVSLGQGASGTAYVSVNPEYGFTGSANLAVTGLPSGVTASWSVNPTDGVSYLTLAASSSAAVGQYPLTITGTYGDLKASAALVLSVFSPTFTVSGASGVSVGQGSSSTAYVSVNPEYGFTGSVNLAVTGLPSGVTASWSPNPTTGSSVLTLTAGSSVVPGQYTATITGTSGNLKATAALSFVIYAPSFTLSSPGNMTIGQGSSGTSYVSVNSEYGFAGGVNLSVSGLPSGVTASWSPNPTTTSSSLTLTASSSVVPGQYTATITGTSGNLKATTTLSFEIYAPSFTLSGPGNLTVGQGSSATSYTNVYSEYGFTGSVNLSVSGLPSGVTASWSPNPTAGSSVLTLTASSTAAVGQYNVTVTGTSGTIKASSTFTATVAAPSFTLSEYDNPNVVPGGSGTAYVNINSQNGFAGSVTLSVSGLPSGVTASFSPSPTTESSTLTLTASTSAVPGQYNLTITGISGSLKETTTAVLTVSALGFTIGSYGNLSVDQGSSSTSDLYVASQSGSTGSVNFAVSGLPTGVTASFSPNPTATGSTVMTLTASSTAPTGLYNVIVTGVSGTVKASATLALQIYAPSFTIYGLDDLNVGRGSSSSSYVFVNQGNGFTGNVTFAISGLPSGVTASFSPNPASFASTLTVTASSSATLGQYTVTVTGTSGNVKATTTFPLGIYTPSFTIANYDNLNLGQGSSGTSYISVSPQNGFTGNVTFSISGLPSGVTASFSPNPTATGSSTLTLKASSTAALGEYNLTLTGTSGSLKATTIVPVTISPQSFTISDYGNVSMGQGSSSTSFAYVDPQNGFTGNVTFAVSGLPSGVTASFSPNPTTGSSTLTLTASSTAALGQYNMTLIGTSGSLKATTVVPVTVYPPSFTISDYEGAGLGQGSSGTSYVYVNAQNGFTGSVTFAASGLPSGVTASFSPNPTTGYSVVTLTASSSAPLGEYNVTLIGTSGTLKATTLLPVTIYPQSFTLSDYGDFNIGQGSSGTSYIQVSPQWGFTGNVKLAVSGLPKGVTTSFSANPTAPGTSVMTLAVSSTAALGQYPLTITGASGSLTASNSAVLTIYPANFTLSGPSALNIGQGTSTTSYIYLSSQYGFPGSVKLTASGLPTGVTASFSPNPATPGYSTLTLTASSSTALGQYNVTVTGTDGSLTASTSFTLGVYVPSFSLSDSWNTNMGQGASSTSYVSVNPQYGFSGDVSLTVSGLPSGLTGSFSPNPTTGNSTLTLTASSSATPGQYTVTITGTSGSLTAKTTFSLGVYVPTFTLGYYPLPTASQGSSSESYVYVYSEYGFTGSVKLALSGLPGGVTASFSPNPIAPGYSILTLTASSSAVAGVYTAILTGTSGALSVSISMNVTITSASTAAATILERHSALSGTQEAGSMLNLELQQLSYPRFRFTGTIGKEQGQAFLSDTAALLRLADCAVGLGEG